MKQLRCAVLAMKRNEGRLATSTRWPGSCWLIQKARGGTGDRWHLLAPAAAVASYIWIYVCLQPAVKGVKSTERAGCSSYWVAAQCFPMAKLPDGTNDTEGKAPDYVQVYCLTDGSSSCCCWVAMRTACRRIVCRVHAHLQLDCVLAY